MSSIALFVLSLTIKVELVKAVVIGMTANKLDIICPPIKPSTRVLSMTTCDGKASKKVDLYTLIKNVAYSKINIRGVIKDTKNSILSL